METFDRTRLQRLTNHGEPPCVSLFFETHPAGKSGEQDAIRLKNLLREAERQLTGHWMRAAHARQLLDGAARLPGDSSFWSKRRNGLAVFVAPNMLETYRLPMSFAEQVAVADRFRVRPLLPLLEHQLAFFLLTISENQVAFYTVDEQSIEKIDVPGMPVNLATLLNYVGADRGSQVHSGARDAWGKQAAVFHGQGGQPDTKQEERLAYCAEIDKSVAAWLGESTTLLLVAGVESLVALYRKKNSYKYLLGETLAGNHDYDSEYALHNAAWRLVRPLFQSNSRQAAARYRERMGSQLVSDNGSGVVTAAIQGRVDALFYDPKAELFGEVDAEGVTVRVTGAETDEDLVDLAAVRTLRYGGTIHSMTDQDLPTNSPLAAVLRY